MVINLIHNNDPDIPEFPRATLLGSTWVEGKPLARTYSPSSICKVVPCCAYLLS